MKIKMLTLVSACFSLFILSCKKDNPGVSSADIKGTYDFISMSSTTTSTQIMSFGGETNKSVSISSWVSENNKGSLTIDNENFITTALSYSVNATTKSYTYSGSTIIDSTTIPFYFNTPPSNGNSTYHMEGNNKIVIESGSVFMQGNTTTTEPVTAQIKMTGDILTLSFNENQTSQQSQGGIDIKMTTDVKMDITFRKKN